MLACSWDLGSCVQSELLGSGGDSGPQAPLLRSLSRTADCTCENAFVNESQIDMSAFRQLRRLN